MKINEIPIEELIRIRQSSAYAEKKSSYFPADEMSLEIFFEKNR
jgi:hypothetical protein